MGVPLRVACLVVLVVPVPVGVRVFVQFVHKVDADAAARPLGCSGFYAAI